MLTCVCDQKYTRYALNNDMRLTTGFYGMPLNVSNQLIIQPLSLSPSLFPAPRHKYNFKGTHGSRCANHRHCQSHSSPMYHPNGGCWEEQLHCCSKCDYNTEFAVVGSCMLADSRGSAPHKLVRVNVLGWIWAVYWTQVLAWLTTKPTLSTESPNSYILQPTTYLIQSWAYIILLLLPSVCSCFSVFCSLPLCLITANFLS